METVVAMNISFDKITWVMEDKNRRLLDWRNTQFFDKPTFRYNHLLYQEKLLEAVNDLPDSDIFLIRSSTRHTKSLGKVKYLIDASVIEAIIVMLINATKGKPMTRTERQEDMEEDDMDPLTDRLKAEKDLNARLSHPDSEFDSCVEQFYSKNLYEITNKVHVFHNRNLKSFSSAKGERLSIYPFVTELIKEGTGPLAGLHIPHYFHTEILKLNKLQEKEGLALCLLMADLVVKFCRNLEVEEAEEETEEDKTVTSEP